MFRKVAAVLPLVVLLASASQPALGHPTTEFDACTGDRNRVTCRNHHAILAGGGVWIHAHAEPSHRGQAVRIWRRNPDGRWIKVAHRPTLGPLGWVRWLWDTDESQVSDERYWFRVIIPDHGRSDTVTVGLAGDEF